MATLNVRRARSVRSRRCARRRRRPATRGRTAARPAREKRAEGRGLGQRAPGGGVEVRPGRAGAHQPRLRVDPLTVRRRPEEAHRAALTPAGPPCRPARWRSSTPATAGTPRRPTFSARIAARLASTALPRPNATASIIAPMPSPTPSTAGHPASDADAGARRGQQKIARAPGAANRGDHREEQERDRALRCHESLPGPSPRPASRATHPSPPGALLDGGPRRIAVQLRGGGKEVLACAETSGRCTTSNPAATHQEIRASSRQFVRKLSGVTRPSKANELAFDRAVDEVAKAARDLLDSLVTNAPPRDRDVEAAKARARAADRFRSSECSLRRQG